MASVSIIVPIYNAEQYVARCIDSIIAQSYTDWELLLIDDGSTDNSASVCVKYAENDNRIRLIRKPNGGVSSARNLGLDNAEGDWIMFVDADDWLDTKTLAICMQHSEGRDIIRFSMFRFKNENLCHRVEIPLPTTKEEYLRQVIAQYGNTIVGVCTGLFRREIFTKHDIRFDTSLKCGEDWLVLSKYIYWSENFIILPDNLYYYDVGNQGSCTNSFTLEKAIHAITALQRISEYIPNPEFDEAKLSIRCLLWNLYFTTYMRMKHRHHLITEELYPPTIAEAKRAKIRRSKQVKLIAKLIGHRLQQIFSK